MKTFLFVFLFLFSFAAQANDTLTRAQVYNFNVGDTFDYKFAAYVSDDNITADTGYLRNVIKDIYYSVDSNTLFVVRHSHKTDIIRGNPVVHISDFDDTLRVDSVNNFLFSDLDTFLRGEYNLYYYADTSYRGRVVNGYHLFIPLGGLYYRFYGQGLGQISGGWGYNDGCCTDQQYDTTLIYYSKGAETWGTPFYNLPTGIVPLEPLKSSVTLFPTINTGHFKINITSNNSADYQLTIYDLTGREIKGAVLHNNINDIEMPNGAAGMYLWNVVSHREVLQLGKMVVE